MGGDYWFTYVYKSHVRWWRRLLARARQRIGTAAQRRTAQRGIAMPQRRAARRARPGWCPNLPHGMGR